MAAPAHAGFPRRGPRPRRPGRWGWSAAPAAVAVVGAAALFLPWWRAPGGVVLGGEPLRALPPDVWTGIEVAGPRAAVVTVLAVAAVVTAVVDDDGPVRRAGAAAAGAAAAACAGAAFVGWGVTGAPGAGVALVAGLAAVAAALVRPPGTVRPPLVLGVALVAAAATVAVPGSGSVARPAVGPFVRVAAIAGWLPVRSGAAGLPGTQDDVRPVVVDGAPGVVGAAGVVVADAHGRARVLGRTGHAAPPPLGVARGRVARWVTADALAVTELRADGPVRVVVRDVGDASVVGDDGSIWLRSVLDPPETVRRLDLGAYAGEQNLSATFLPVVTIQNPDGEGPVDVRTVRPVPGGALRVAFPEGGEQVQLLSGTPAGIAVQPLTVVNGPPCRYPAVAGTGLVRATAADATGVWYPTPDRHLAHRAPDGTVRTVPARLPATIDALAAPGDGSVLFLARDDRGTALWRLPDAAAALTDPPPC